ncbi:FtsX-like permease family protein [Pseudomaricurvus alcaniphilus]|uniref:FtsX-like permease family protein n=1 Tax=Pseudomaricurvus alcaniphilus TaxID=1166482 RepID=UPI001407CF11|nr:FtsX-like permease family protein [Pseudomaricurvus alcaniphilus]
MLALRLLWRNWRGGELRILAAALVLAVTVVSAIAILTERLQFALEAQSQTLLGANLAAQSSQPLPAEWSQYAAEAGVRTARTAEFSSMVFAGEQMHLSSVKAVSSGYPLLGKLTISKRKFATDPDDIEVAGGIPAPGEVWVDSRLLPLLNIELGDSIQVGELELQVSRVVINEPDRGGGFSAIGARVMMNYEDMAATEVVQPGSRVKYRLLLAAERAPLEQLQAVLEPLLTEHQKLVDIESSQRGLARSMETGRKFLLLASMIAVLLAGVAIAMAARRFAGRQVEQVALIKSLGCSRAAISKLFLVQLLVLGAITALVGLLLGELLQRLIAESLAALFPLALADASWHAYWPGVVTGMVCLAAFVLPPLWHLPTIPPIKILRRELPVNSVHYYAQALLGLLAMLLLVGLFSADLRLLGITAAAILMLVAVGGGLAALLLRSAETLKRLGGSWRLALSALKRNRHHSLIQMLVFALAVMLLLTLIGVRTSLLEDWQQQLPEGAPNHFLLNIAPHEVDEVQQLLAARQLQPQPMYPMVRARLTHINGAKPDERQRQQVGVLRRENNLSWASQLGADNKLVQGQWWDQWQHDPDQVGVSLEAEVAEELGVQPGDQLRFSVGGLELNAEVASVRTVQWDSMNPNFYFLFSPGALDQFSPMYLTSVFVAPGDKLVVNDILLRFPTVLVIEMDRVIAQIQSIIIQVSEGIEWMLWLVLIAGFMVMWASVSAGIDERMQEVALLRAMGSSRSRLLGSLWAEFSLLGLCAGVMAVAGAELMLWSVQKWMLQIEPQSHPELWLFGLAFTPLVIGAMGVFACRRVVTTSPAMILQEFG